MHRAARRQWLTPVILATQEAEIRRITVQSQPRQTVHETPISKNLITKKGWGVAQGIRPQVQTPVQEKKKKSTEPRTA
jgi:hypothetical protein